jgi:hypothetical protein
MTALPKKTTFETIVAGTLLERHWKQTLHALDSFGRPVYIGRHEKESPTIDDTGWYIWKNVWSDKGLINTEGPIVGAWQDRESLAWKSSLSGVYDQPAISFNELDELILIRRVLEQLSIIVNYNRNKDNALIVSDGGDLIGVKGEIDGKIEGLIDDTTYRPVRVDSITHTLQTIDYAHHEIHSGSFFTCHYSQTSPTNVGEMTIIAFNTPNSDKLVHMFAFASSTAASIFTIYEASALDVGEGTQLTVYNRNRNSSKTSDITSVEATPVVNKATSFSVVQAASANLVTTYPIHKKYLGAAAAGADTSGETRENDEIILKKNTQYAFVIENTTADDNTHNIVLNWYEHTDRN